MKKFFITLMSAVLLFSSCADNKTFEKSDGTTFTATPYGWINKEDKIEGVQYELSSSTLVWSIVLGETVVAPILLTGFELYEPVDYVEKELDNNAYLPK